MLYKHDCDKCISLGEYNGHDLYLHPAPHKTLIARFGDDGPEYISGLSFIGLIDEITEAARRAKKEGYLN